MLDQLPPFLGGGEMIETVAMERSTFAGIPHKFEAGTPPIVEAVGLGAAVDYLGHVGMENVAAHERAITGYALEGLATVPGLTVMGPLDAALRGGAISFEIDGVHPHDVARCSTRAASPSGPGTTAPSRRTPGSGCRARRGCRRTSTRRRAEIDALVEGLNYTTLLLQAELRRMSQNSSELDALYQEIILDHYKHPHHKGPARPLRGRGAPRQPDLRRRGDPARAPGRRPRSRTCPTTPSGCSISQASTSVMTDLVIGKPVDEAMAIHEEFLTLMQGKGTVEPDEEVLEDGIAFAGVAKFPARVKCALLSWMAWKDATAQARVDGGQQVSESSTDQQAPSTDDHATTPSTTRRPARGPAGGAGTGSVSVDDVTEAMKDVVDPELGINVVDLGLVYDVHLDEGSNVVLDMTLTSAACPLTDVIMDQTNSALEGLVNDVAINWVWMPPWGPDKITPDGREQLRALGFNV